MLPISVSPCPDPEATEVNALSLSWNKWNRIYLFPPPIVLPEVIDHLEDFTGQGILIAPYWPKAPWFIPLLEKDPYPVPLPVSCRLWQGISRGIVYHEYPNVFKLHAWKL